MIDFKHSWLFIRLLLEKLSAIFQAISRGNYFGANWIFRFSTSLLPPLVIRTSLCVLSSVFFFDLKNFIKKFSAAAQHFLCCFFFFCLFGFVRGTNGSCCCCYGFWQSIKRREGGVEYPRRSESLAKHRKFVYNLRFFLCQTTAAAAVAVATTITRHLENPPSPSFTPPQALFCGQICNLN